MPPFCVATDDSANHIDERFFFIRVTDNRRSTLLLRPGAGSLPANSRIADENQKYFPEFKFEVVDVRRIIRRRRTTKRTSLLKNFSPTLLPESI